MNDDFIEWEHYDYVLNGDDPPAGGKKPKKSGSPQKGPGSGCGCFIALTAVLVILIALILAFTDKM